MAPYQGFRMLAPTLKERASELIRKSIREPLELKKDSRRLLPCMGEYQIFIFSLFLSLSFSLSLSPSLSAGRSGQVEIPDKAYLCSFRITCACEFISYLWGDALARSLCACSHVEGTCLGTQSVLNARTIGT